MDVVGSEIGQKMRSAIKAKLTELGCYVDDELPDYVMVMVANKRTQMQMEDDLQLFLGDNTELFVNWLHQVLKKLQEVTVAVPLKMDKEKAKERSVSKERKSKEKKDKDKTKKGDAFKKLKKKDKEKLHHKKEKKVPKSKKDKKSKSRERIRPNIPPLLMNMEKDSEPSITDVFAGQILKNHGVNLDIYKDDMKIVEAKPIIKDKRRILPVIDPASILEPERSSPESQSSDTNTSELPRESQLKEINDIEAKIQGLKQKLVEQLDSMSDDEDFLTIRTEAEELMNDFAEDVFKEISQPTNVAPFILDDTSQKPKNTQNPNPKEPTHHTIEIPKLPTEHPKVIPAKEMKEIKNKDPVEALPQIELNLPKRPIRERLGARNFPKARDPEVKETGKQKSLSPESFTPEREIVEAPVKASKSQQSGRKASEHSPKRDDGRAKEPMAKLSSRVCASVGRVRPRPRASNLLLRAVADAHKSLLSIPPKVETQPTTVKRALVLPMRRCVDPKKIVIQVAADRQTDEDIERRSNDISIRFVSNTRPKEEYTPIPLSKRITNSDYVPTRSATSTEDSLIIETINIHNPTVGKDKDTQFIVTMDGYHPNAFLAKKLMTEGLLDDEEESEKLKTPKAPKERDVNKKDKKEPSKAKLDLAPVKDIASEKNPDENKPVNIVLDKKKNEECKAKEAPISSAISQKKRLSDTSEDSDTQVIIKKEDEKVEKRKSCDASSVKETHVSEAKKRRASPIVFDVEKKESGRDAGRERTSVPGVPSQGPRCRAFPSCRFGPSCVFGHPRCKFAASCTRRGCLYAHDAPSIASHVVPVANFKSVPSSIPSLCKFYPNCVNSSCHFYHPKPCRFGKACANKLECNFYHADVPAKMFPL